MCTLTALQDDEGEKNSMCARVCLMYLMLLIWLPMKLLWFFVLKHVCFYLIRVCDVMKYNGPEEEDTMAIRILNKYKCGSIKYTWVMCVRVLCDRECHWHALHSVTLNFIGNAHFCDWSTHQPPATNHVRMMKKIATTPKINITSANTFCYIFISAINIKYFHFNSLSGCTRACVCVPA